VAAERDDLAVLEGEARKRWVGLAHVLREGVEREARRLRGDAARRFGVVRGDGSATRAIAADEVETAGIEPASAIA